MKRCLYIALFLAFCLFPLAAQATAAQNAAASAPAAGSNARSSADGSRLYSLDETLHIFPELEFRWDPFFREGSFIVEGHYGAFSSALEPATDGFLMIDNRDIYPVTLPYQHNGELVFPESFIQTAKEAFTHTISEDASHYRIAAIIIDPGHGGKDPGAVSKHTINGKSVQINEKDINLNASLMLRDLLSAAYPDKRILMTREKDITCSLEERTVIANAVPIRKNEAIIYISIHANYSRHQNVKGYEVFHLKPDKRRNVMDESQFADSPELRKILNLITEEAYIAESIRIAESILNAIKAAVGNAMPSRGLKDEDWFVVRRSRMPAVLVELGFVSNKDDAILMTTDVHLRKLADALYKGIAEFVGDFERSGGFIAAR